MNLLKILRRPQFAMFLASLVLFVSCEQYDNESLVEIQVQNSSAKFSGQELFSSVIFMDGQATSLFPTIENNFDINEYLNTSEKKEQYKNMQQEALEFIQKENPDFFRNFQESMYSQNPVIIKKALINGAETLIPFLSDELKDKGLNYDITLNNPEEFDKLKKEFKDEYAKYQNNNLQAKEQTCGVFALAALVVVVAAAVLYIVVVSEVAFWSAQLQDVANERSLLPEELTLEIATHLY